MADADEILRKASEEIAREPYQGQKQDQRQQPIRRK
jgi:hypothetical protein